MSKPHVLMLTPYLPYPPNSGGRSRTYNLVKHLSKHYEITLVCFGRPEEKAFDLAPMEALVELIVVDRAPSPGTLQAALLSVTSAKPVTMRLYHTAEMSRTVAQILNTSRVDLIHVESFYMLPNLPQQLDVPVLLSEPAIEYIAWWRHARVAQPVYTRPGIALEALKMRWWEPRSWAEATVVGAMSHIDAALIKEATPGVRTALAPNGVDVDFFQMDESVQRDNRTAVYLGDYKYFPNTDAVLYFAREILPRVRAKRGDFQLVLLGKDAPASIRELHNDPDTAVTVAGFVPDTRPFLQGSAMFVCPLRSGSGTRFKLMEALACGCPVISTTVGAEGLNAIDGKHMLLRDDPQAFADAIIDLLDHPQMGDELGRAGREWVVAQHAWERSAAQLQQVYDQIIGHEDPTLDMNRREKRVFQDRLQDAMDEESPDTDQN